MAQIVRHQPDYIENSSDKEAENTVYGTAVPNHIIDKMGVFLSANWLSEPGMNSKAIRH